MTRSARFELYRELRRRLARYPEWVRKDVASYLDAIESEDGHNGEGMSGRRVGTPTRRSTWSDAQLEEIYRHAVETDFLGDDGTGCVFFEREYGCNQRLISQLRYEPRYARIRAAVEGEE